MNEQDIKETKIWELYNKATDYANKKGYFDDVDLCNDFYLGNQWRGLIVEGIKPVSLPFIDTIVDLKVSKIANNLRSINYSTENADSQEFRIETKKVCELFNQRASRVWEKDQMDDKITEIAFDSAINSEGVMYVTYDKEEKNPVNEVLSKVDVFYGNENEPDIERQPYILIKKRVSVLEAREIAKDEGVSEKEIELITGDKNTEYEAGIDSEDELDDMVTIVTKLFKSNGKVWYAKATRYVDIKENTEMEITRYPVAHMIWKKKQGSARGEGEVKSLIPNQIETNKTLLRRLLTAKNTAYPQKVYNSDVIENPEQIDVVGGKIEVHGMQVDDVNKAFSVTKPAQMSPDVEKLQGELINTTRDLKNASNVATGQINPEQASGKAILAVQKASEQPLNKYNKALNKFCEDIARIWMDMWKSYNDGMKLENITTDPQTGEELVEIVTIKPSVLEKLKTNVKIDITPKGAYDKYAQELSLENLAASPNFMNTEWLEDYLSLLDYDSTMPRSKIEDLVKRRKEQQQQIRAIQQKGALIQQRVSQLLNTGEIVPKELAPENMPTL